MALKTDYKADVFEGNRKYQIIQDGEGKSEILDVTEYSQEGDVFGPNDINTTNKAVNALNHVVPVTLQASGWSTAAPYPDCADRGADNGGQPHTGKGDCRRGDAGTGESV